MMLVKKSTYADSIVPSLQKLKFDFVGHDQLVLHERDIRRQKDAFAFLQVDQTVRVSFLAAIDKVFLDADMSIYASVIHKQALKDRYADPFSPYDLALSFLMEKLLFRLQWLGQIGKLVHVVFECRGKKEDAELELTFRRIASNQFNWGYKSPDFTKLRWEPLFVDKKANSSGLQIADLVARPIGLHAINPVQANHAYDVALQKIATLKVFP